MHESVNEDDPQGAALTPAGPDVCFHTGHVLKLCEDKRGEGDGGCLMWGGGGEGVMHFSTHHGFVRNPAGQVRELSECKRKKVFPEPLGGLAMDWGRWEMRGGHRGCSHRLS